MRKAVIYGGVIIVIVALFLSFRGSFSSSVEQGESNIAGPGNGEVTDHDVDHEENIEPDPDNSQPETSGPDNGAQEGAEEEAGDDLAASLDRQEKIGQLVIVGVDGESLSKQDKDRIEDDQVGGFILYNRNLKSVEQASALINDLKAANKANPLPLWMSVDEEGGKVSRLPKPIVKLPSSRQIGKLDDIELTKQIGKATGQALDAFGFNMDYAPVLDIDSNPDNPVIGSRSFGRTAELVSKHGITLMTSMQVTGVVPVIKHFPGHGDTSVDSHISLPVLKHTRDRLDTVELVPFKNAIAEGAEVIMIAHLMIPELDAEHPASLSPAVITDLLRNELKFDGVVITDDLTMGAIVGDRDIGDAAVQSIVAGADIVLIGHDAAKQDKVISALRAAVEDGVITDAMLNKKLSRITALKQKYKLNDDPRPPVDVKKINQHIEGAGKPAE
ncbi:beta-N-acetylhexosaminidase [Paenibacillaceae bacterium]|nr:beta-N-acetylhexosaminidase [Paenibacillaceae bacterium]